MGAALALLRLNPSPAMAQSFGSCLAKLDSTRRNVLPVSSAVRTRTAWPWMSRLDVVAAQMSTSVPDLSSMPGVGRNNEVTCLVALDNTV